MKHKVIKTELEYQQALARLEEIIDAEPDTPEMEELELLALLVDTYENAVYPVDLPDPIEAIKFRMEQQGLTRKDMQAYLGSPSRVSEVLNGKRPLSKEMMRRLHSELGIPADVLLQEPGRSDVGPCLYDPSDYPINEMVKRKYHTFDCTAWEAKATAEERLERLFAVFQGQTRQPVYCRRTDKVPDAFALEAWQAQVLFLASRQDVDDYVSGTVSEDWIRGLLQLSSRHIGPTEVEQYLADRGIHFVLLEHLPKTYLDGACFVAPDGHPVIAMTLRHDRIDNFWFTLAHELAHLVLHLDDDAPLGRVFFDELDNGGQEQVTDEEQEANEYAANLLISDDVWQQYAAHLASPASVVLLAARLGLSPAIVAGRCRWESGNYQLYDKLLGRGQVRVLFQDEVPVAAAL